MPFDGKNFTETKPDVFSLEGLIAWLEKQPAETEYDFLDISDCVLCRYFRATGMTNVCVGGTTYSATGQWGKLPETFVLASVAKNAAGRRTYAAALSRARALQSRAA